MLLTNTHVKRLRQHSPQQLLIMQGERFGVQGKERMYPVCSAAIQRQQPHEGATPRTVKHHLLWMEDTLVVKHAFVCVQNARSSYHDQNSAHRQQEPRKRPIGLGLLQDQQ